MAKQIKAACSDIDVFDGWREIWRRVTPVNEQGAIKVTIVAYWNPVARVGMIEGSIVPSGLTLVSWPELRHSKTFESYSEAIEWAMSQHGDLAEQVIRASATGLASYLKTNAEIQAAIDEIRSTYNAIFGNPDGDQ